MTAETTDTTSETEGTTESSETETTDTQAAPETGKPNNVADMEKALRKANKEAETLRLKVKEFEDAKLSESERLTEAKNIAEKAADDARVEATRLRLGIRHGLSEEDLEFLPAGTDEEMEDRAKRLAERIKATPAPKPDRTQGAKGEQPEETDPAKLAANVRRNRW